MDIYLKICEELEKLTDRDLEELDAEFLIEELLERSNDFKDTVISWLAINIEFRFKIQYLANDDLKIKNRWAAIVNRTITNIKRKFRRTPSLESFLRDDASMEEAYFIGVETYQATQFEYDDLQDLPDNLTNPWTYEELLTRIEKFTSY